MKKWSIRYADGQHGPLLSREAAQRWFDDIAPDRKPFCELTCWEQVTDPTAETLRPESPDPFSHEAFRQTLETLPDLSPTKDGGLPEVLEHPANKMAREAIRAEQVTLPEVKR